MPRCDTSVVKSEVRSENTIVRIRDALIDPAAGPPSGSAPARGRPPFLEFQLPAPSHGARIV